MKHKHSCVMIAIGFLCVAVNLEVNGYGVLFPTAVGYGLIAVGFNDHREGQKTFLFISIIAAILAVLTLPHLIRGEMEVQNFWQTYNQAIGPIALYLNYLLWLLVAFGLYMIAVLINHSNIRNLALLAFSIVIGVIAIWELFLEVDGLTFTSYILYNLPAFYFAIVAWIASRSVPTSFN